MKQLNIDRINAKAPYKVSEDGKQLVILCRHHCGEPQPAADRHYCRLRPDGSFANEQA